MLFRTNFYGPSLVQSNPTLMWDEDRGTNDLDLWDELSEDIDLNQYVGTTLFRSDYLYCSHVYSVHCSLNAFTYSSSLYCDIKSVMV